MSVRVPVEGDDEGEDAAVPRHVPTVRYADVAGQAAAVQADGLRRDGELYAGLGC